METGSLTKGPGRNADSTSSLPTPGLLPPLNTGVHTEHHTRHQRSAWEGSRPAQPSCAWTVGRGPWGRAAPPVGRAPGAEARAWGWYAAVLWSAGSKDSAERLWHQQEG